MLWLQGGINVFGCSKRHRKMLQEGIPRRLCEGVCEMSILQGAVEVLHVWGDMCSRRAIWLLSFSFLVGCPAAVLISTLLVNKGLRVAAQLAIRS